jgi:hypothetical protein
VTDTIAIITEINMVTINVSCHSVKTFAIPVDILNILTAWMIAPDIMDKIPAAMKRGILFPIPT